MELISGFRGTKKGFLGAEGGFEELGSVARSGFGNRRVLYCGSSPSCRFVQALSEEQPLAVPRCPSSLWVYTSTLHYFL